jgi:hypothetical protein
MKKIMFLAPLLSVIFVGESFTGSAGKAGPPPYSVTIDNAPFEARVDDNYTAQLINNSKTASIVLVGKEVHDKNGNIFPSKITIDYTMRDDALGEVNVEKVTYEYNNHVYNLVAGSAYMSITKMKWNADKRSAVMCADVFCKVKKDYIAEEFVPVFAIRGQLQNITILAPAS